MGYANLNYRAKKAEAAQKIDALQKEIEMQENIIDELYEKVRAANSSPNRDRFKKIKRKPFFAGIKKDYKNYTEGESLRESESDA